MLRVEQLLPPAPKPSEAFGSPYAETSTQVTGAGSAFLVASNGPVGKHLGEEGNPKSKRKRTDKPPRLQLSENVVISEEGEKSKANTRSVGAGRSTGGGGSGHRWRVQSLSCPFSSPGFSPLSKTFGFHWPRVLVGHQIFPSWRGQFLKGTERSSRLGVS